MGHILKIFDFVTHHQHWHKARVESWSVDEHLEFTMAGCADDECEISGGCFSKGATKEGDECQVCAPAQNHNGWTPIEGNI